MKTPKCYVKIILTFLLFGLLSQDVFCQSARKLLNMYWGSPDTTFVINKRKEILTIIKRESILSIVKEKKKDRTDIPVIFYFSYTTFSDADISELNKKLSALTISLTSKKIERDKYLELVLGALNEVKATKTSL